MKKCGVFPVEFVCRGFMTGSTDTSLWTHYAAGARTYCGNDFPDGMRKNDRLAQVRGREAGGQGAGEEGRQGAQWGEAAGACTALVACNCSAQALPLLPPLPPPAPH